MRKNTNILFLILICLLVVSLFISAEHYLHLGKFSVADDGEVWAVSIYGDMQTATGDGTTTVDWGLGNFMYFTFGAANETFTFTAPANKGKMTLILKQDATGGWTATWPGTVKWPQSSAPTLSTEANDIDIVSFFWDGTNYFGVANLDFD